MAIQILIVDDHKLLRQGLVSLLRQAPGMLVTGECSDGREALVMARSLRPDVIVMDMAMPNLNGVDATRQILADIPSVKIIALTARTDQKMIGEALRAGAVGYLSKMSAVDELVDAITTVMQGERYLGMQLTQGILSDFLNKEPEKVESALTLREREVLQLLAEGKAMKEAATTLELSVKTVETHRRAIMQKLNVFSVAELTKHAIREGLTSL